MSNWKRITLVVFVLIGGTLSFAYWSQRQFNSAISDLETALTANILLVSPSLKEDAELASASPDISKALVTPPDLGLASTSPDISKTSVVSADLEFSFNFPQKDDKVYVGCTYPISWQSSITINSLEIILADAGAREPIDPIVSGLTKESIIETVSQNLNWKVGVVWPGAYYIKISKINGVDVEIRSKVFSINNMPKGINTDEQEKICKNSGGLF